MVVKKDDRLKSLFTTGYISSNGPEEVNMSTFISPVAKIKVVWVGWGWSNAVNRMIETWLEWVDFIAINTDAQALFGSNSPKKIHIGRAVTKWLWAGSNPDLWKKAAEESIEELKAALEWADMVFITCGLGGGTGTWASPIVAEVARELWALTVWVVTKPFSFEWKRRMEQATDGFDKLADKVDALITIPNDKILSMIDKRTPYMDALSIIDEVLNQWVKWISDLIINPGDVNLDFADIKSVMSNAWSALIGIWYGSWDNRAVEAARSAIDSPLLELSIAWAKWLIVNITWGTDLSMYEIDEAVKIITDSVDENANIKVGTSIDEHYTGEIKITVVATWFDENTNKKFVETGSSMRNTPFGKKPINDVKPISVPSQSKPVNNNSWEDYDVPAFLRKKI